MNLEMANQTKALASADLQRLKDTLLDVSKGSFQSDIIDRGGFTNSELHMLSQNCPILKQLFKEARDLGHEARQHMREDAADQRGIVGVKEPIYSVKGEYVGERTVYSDTLLALTLKANNPTKYGPAATGGGSGGVVLNVNMGIDRGPKQLGDVDVKPKKWVTSDEEAKNEKSILTETGG